MKAPTVASLFSGIGGFDLGFERAGFRVVLQVELDSACREVLGKHFSALCVHDVRAIASVYCRIRAGRDRQLLNYEKWKRLFALLRDAAVFCGGFPCQDVSLAGPRAGLAGERSGLWFAFRRLVALFRPPWVVAENVTGLLSSNEGCDLAVILHGLEKLGYRWAYRVLDAQFFGVAQRRERVFIVASLGNFACAEVLFERDSVCGDSAESGEARARDSHPLARRARGSSAVAGTVSPKWSKYSGGPSGDECQNLVPIAFDATQITSATNRSRCDPGAPCHTLAADQRPPTFAFSSKDFGCDAVDDLAPTLRAMPHRDSHQNGGGQVAVAEPDRGVRRATPLECERFQGFPDGWTDGFPDATRYRITGNAVAVPCAEWIAERLLAAHRRFSPLFVDEQKRLRPAMS